MKKGTAVWDVKSNSLTAVSFCRNWGKPRQCLAKNVSMGKKDKAACRSRVCFHPCPRRASPPSELVSQQSKDVQIRVWRAVVFAGRWAQFPAVRGVPWKGLHIRLMLHPTTHRNRVLSISVTSLARNSIILLWRSTFLTLSPHHREQRGKSIPVRRPLEFLVPKRRLFICIQCLSPFPDVPELTEALTQPGLVTQVLKHAWVAPTPHPHSSYSSSLCELK